MKCEIGTSKTINPTPRGYFQLDDYILNSIEGKSKEPFSWIEYGVKQAIKNGRWNSIHFKSLDIITTLLHKDLQKRKITKKQMHCYSKDLPNSDIEECAIKLYKLKDTLPHPAEPVDRVDLSPLIKTNHFTFTVNDFKNYFGKSATTKDITTLLNNICKTEFKINLPIAYKQSVKVGTHFTEKIKTTCIPPRHFHKLFNFTYKDELVGKKIIRNFFIYFNTFLGWAFYNNVQAGYLKEIDPKIYKLKIPTQMFYRKFFATNIKHPRTYLSPELVVNRMSFMCDKSSSPNTKNRIEGILDELKNNNFITDWCSKITKDGSSVFEISRR